MNIHQDVKEENKFYCRDGSVLKNLQELAQNLKAISNEAFAHHVNPEKNDFASWISGCYGNDALAKKIAKAKTAKSAARMLEDALSKKPKPAKSKPGKKKKQAKETAHTALQKQLKNFAKKWGMF